MVNTNKLEIDITKAISKEIRKNIDDGFIGKKTPKGKKWPKDKNGTQFDPNDSIRNSITVKTNGNTITIDSKENPITGYLNFGTSSIKPHEMYPDDYYPTKWTSIEAVIDKIMEDTINDTKYSSRDS